MITIRSIALIIIVASFWTALSPVKAQSADNFSKQDSLYATCITSIYEKMDDQYDQEPVTNVPPGGIVKVENRVERSVLDQYRVSYKSHEGYTTTSCFKLVDDENINDLLKYNSYIDSLRKEGLSVILDVAEGDEPNSAGGVDYEVEIFNNSRSRTIKYVNFEATPYNPVGDKVTGRIKEQSTTTMEGVGPIEPSGHAYFNFDNVWYNSTISCVELKRMVVEYVDGSQFIYVNDLSKIKSYGSNGGNTDEKSLYINGDCH